MTVHSYAMALMLLASTAFAQTTPQQPPAKPEEPPVYVEQVVVTASKVEQQLVNAPATVSVVTADVIASTPATNYAELFRSVPGVNLSQTSARDFNITMRGATSTLATSTLALLDGRSLYLDFFGFVAWDLLPVNPSELKQIEVIRGPASAVWGANALTGVPQLQRDWPRRLKHRIHDVLAGIIHGYLPEIVRTLWAALLVAGRDAIRNLRGGYPHPEHRLDQC